MDCFIDGNRNVGTAQGCLYLSESGLGKKMTKGKYGRSVQNYPWC